MPLPQRLQDLESAPPGQHQIQHDQVEHFGVRAEEPVLAGRRHDDVVVLRLQGRREHLGQLPFVFDDQHTHGEACYRAAPRPDPDFCVRDLQVAALKRPVRSGGHSISWRSADSQPMLVPTALQRLTGDAWLLFATRFIRLFAYGSLSVVLVFYLVGIGLSEPQTGLLLTLTLVGDTVVSLFLTTRADRIGRRRMLIVGAAADGGGRARLRLDRQRSGCSSLAGTIGVISPSGNEVGPFLSIEQAALSHVVTDRTRTEVFAWYTLAGSLATALGALAGGSVTRAAAADARCRR